MSALPPIAPISRADGAGLVAAPNVSIPDAPPSNESLLTSEMNAFSSPAGVAIRLLHSLPANLGQQLDTAA